MASKPSFGIHLPVRVLPGGDTAPATAELLGETVEAAAASGFESVWVTDHIVWFDPWMDCLVVLGAVVERTARLGMTIASGVVGLPLRNPVAIAQSFATLDVLSGGRLVVGIGEGSTQSDFDALGLPFDERRKMLEDGVIALRKLLSADDVSHYGPYYQFENVSVRPRSSQEPSVPIWLSSWGAPVGVRRVAQLGDGWIASAWHATPEEFAGGLGRLNGELPKHGKDPETFPNAVNTMFVHVDLDGARAHREMGPRIERITNQSYDPRSGHYLVGDSAECREGIQRWVDAGAKNICVWPVVDGPGQARLFGEQVIAKL
jgi:alkanesulfonate monooxygenase SsuD/methylene tetrahydromethanopterin reductase-like flavin-dependent oxidoreductase (luciferase family)